MNKDLTVGKPSSVLWRFCLPLFGSIICSMNVVGSKGNTKSTMNKGREMNMAKTDVPASYEIITSMQDGRSSGILTAG